MVAVVGTDPQTGADLAVQESYGELCKTADPGPCIIQREPGSARLSLTKSPHDCKLKLVAWEPFHMISHPPAWSVPISSPHGYQRGCSTMQVLMLIMSPCKTPYLSAMSPSHASSTNSELTHSLQLFAFHYPQGPTYSLEEPSLS